MFTTDRGAPPYSSYFEGCSVKGTRILTVISIYEVVTAANNDISEFCEELRAEDQVAVIATLLGTAERKKKREREKARLHKGCRLQRSCAYLDRVVDLDRE